MRRRSARSFRLRGGALRTGACWNDPKQGSKKMSSASRSFARVWQRLAACSIILCIVSSASAQTSVVHIEEHWEMRLAQPESDRSAPQTTMVMSTEDSLGAVHFLFTLNHVSVPDYEPGGMQIQAWDGEQLLNDRIAEEVGALSHAGEVVRWVQKLTLNDGTLSFRVADGESETWGDFGGDDLSIEVPSSLTSLNSYKPGVSITESQVGYAENRVESLTLTKLVWITDDGEVHELNAPIAVDTSLDP
jgi:hypothetical protein